MTSPNRGLQKVQTIRLFPTLIHLEDLKLGRAPGLGSVHRRLVDECLAFRELDTPGKRWSRRNYFNGYTSYGSRTDLPERSPTFQKLRTVIDRSVARYCRALELDLRGGRLEMSSCWINIMGVGTQHSFHIHPLSTISGTYYLQVPPGAGSFKIEDPRLGFLMASPPRKANAKRDNQRFIELQPREGQLLLFESWLKHEVPANRSDEERISVSFNYDWFRG
jgi:uncharacterized protein (TIGR02466 family)